MKSPAELIASRSVSERQKLIDEIAPTEQDKKALLYEWKFWARPKQVAPDWDWFIWLLLSGRGFGKTRTGAEWVINRARYGPFFPIALIGQTKADVRDTMVELGESSILKISPPWFMPTYEPSKRRLTWPNGMTATIFSGDEPDQLRGPQHGSAWVDELCLIQGTIIETDRGGVKIENIKSGDMVWTRFGLRKVIASGLTIEKAQVYELKTVNGNSIIGTEFHPVWTDNRGFQMLSKIEICDALRVWDKKRNNLLYGVATSGISKRITTIIGKVGFCIERFTLLCMGRYLEAWIFTILMVIKQTIVLKIWKPLLGPSILSGIGQRDGGLAQKRSERKMEVLIGLMKHGNHSRSNAKSAIKHFWQKASGLSFAQGHVINRRKEVDGKIKKKEFAKNAVSPILGTSEKAAFFALRHADQFIQIKIENFLKRINIASYAIRCISQKILGPNVVHGNADINLSPNWPKTKTDKLHSITKVPGFYSVFNLEVEGDHEYFANGILVHNSKYKYPQETWDNLEFGLRLGDNPQVVVTTTPRPIKIIRELYADEASAIVTGSSYENISNLAGRYVDRVIKKYEGTRLGRQELHGVILTDVPGALWTHDGLDADRVRQAPSLKRIVVAIDPAVSANTDSSNETGMVVAGIDADNHGYLLEDLSGIYTPKEWAEKAIYAYDNWQADAVIGESNQGGDLVASNIRSTAQILQLTGQRTTAEINVKLVRATKGKYTRAEPISSIYEQHRVHHVGMFAELEDQLCVWIPGEDSPDRLDALVWAFTELMLNESDADVADLSQIYKMMQAQ